MKVIDFQCTDINMQALTQKKVIQVQHGSEDIIYFTLFEFHFTKCPA